MATKRSTRKPTTRVAVSFGIAGKARGRQQAKKAIVQVLETTQKQFGLPLAQTSDIQVKGKGGTIRLIRGSRGAGSIAVPTGKKTKKGNDQLRYVPVPGDANLNQILTFLRKWKTKPKYFISPDGVKYPVSQGR